MKLIRKFWNIFKTTILTLIVILSAAAIALQSSAVQTFLIQTVTRNLGDAVDGDIQIGKIHLRPFNTIILKDVTILDRHPYEDKLCKRVDTLFDARYVSAGFHLKGLFKGEAADIRYAHVTDATMHLVTEPDTSSAKGSTMNLNRIFGLKPSGKKKEPKDIFTIKKVRLDNFRFRMSNYRNISKGIHNASYGIPETIDWTDIDVQAIYLKGHDMAFKKGVMSGTIASLSCKEKSGYILKELSGSTKVGNGKTIIDDLHLKDLWSDLHLANLTFSYENTQSWSNFEDDVHIDGRISPSVLDLHSISYFAAALKDMSFLTELKGTVKGFVNDFNLKGLQIHTLDSQVSGRLEGRIAAVTSKGNMFMDLQTHDLIFDTDGLGRFIRSWSSKSHLDLSRFAPGQPLILNATLKGLLDNFNVDGTVSHGNGLITTNIDIKNASDKFTPITIIGSLETDEINIGQIIGTDAVGPCSLTSKLAAKLGDEPAISIQSLNVSRLNALNYDYTGIAANGTYSKNTFNGRLICTDPNLNFLFQGIFTTPSKKNSNSIYRFYANLGYADLNALNLDKRGVSRISFQTNTNFNHVKDGNILGQISIKNLTLEDNSGKHDIGDIDIASQVNDNVNRIKLTSKFAEAFYAGSEFLDTFIQDFQTVSTYRELPAIHKNALPEWTGNQYDVDLKFYDCTDILSFVMPGLYVADSTNIHLNINKDGLLKTNLKSRRIALKDKYIKGIKLAIDNMDGKLSGQLDAKELSVSPILMKNNLLQITAEDNKVDLGLQFDNQSQQTNKGEFNLTTRFSRSKEDSLLINASLLNSNVYFESSLWKINPSNIFIGNGHYLVDDLNITNGKQNISIDGGYSRTMTDTLMVSLDQFDLGVMNNFIKQEMDLQSKITGYAKLISPSQENVGILLNMQCDSTSMAGEEIGTLYLKSAWDDIDRCFKFMCNNNLDNKKSLEVRGQFTPANKNIAATADLYGLNLAYAKPFLKSIFNDVQGRLYGKLSVYGPTDHLNLDSKDLRLNNGYLVLDFTKVPYYADGPLKIGNNGLIFDNVRLRDSFGESGVLTGGIIWNHLKDMKMETYVRFADVEAMRTTMADNQSFYGNVFATGTVSISGPFTALLLEVNASTAKNGKFNVPLGNSATSATSNLLTFKEPVKDEYVDPYEVMMNKLKTKEQTTNDMTVRLKLNVNPDTQALIEVDKASGNILTGWGRGYVDLDIKPSKDIFNINGDFNIVGGTYEFGTMRDFTLQNGGTIKFNGDIMDSDLDLTALYKTKTNIGVLIADTTSTSRRHVECGLGVSGKIRNPKINFSINIPDLDPTTQSRVESALSTEDKLQKQFLSVLLTNSFLPDEQSGIVNNTSLLYSNVTEIMSNQLNNILQKLDIPIDLGLDYQQGQNGKNAFDVAVSTELFNNRVYVNGTFGSRQYNNSSNQNNEFVGDLDIEIKLDKSGAFRLNLFSHSADQYSSYLDNSQRSGIGITYQHEFNTIREFFHDIFTGRKQKEAEKKALEKITHSEPKIKIEILPDEN